MCDAADRSSLVGSSVRIYHRNGRASGTRAGSKNTSTPVAYSYVLSAALDAGSSVNALLVFFLSITVFRWWTLPKWLGSGGDAEHCPAQ